MTRPRPAPLVLLAAVLVAGCATEVRFTESDRTSIYRLLKRQRMAWNDGDTEGVLDVYHRGADLVSAGDGRFRHGYLRQRADFRQGFVPGRMGRLSFHDLDIRETGPDTALVLGRWHLEGSEAADGDGVFTLLARRYPEGWRFEVDHSSTER